MSGGLQVTASVTIPEEELQFSAARSGGPGGQHVNTTSSKVVLRFDLGASSALSDAQKERIRARIPPRYRTQNDEVLVTCEEHRDQARNREGARLKLAAALKTALARPKTRKATKPSRASRERRLQAKREQKDKKARRREQY